MNQLTYILRAKLTESRPLTTLVSLLRQGLLRV